MSATLVLTNGRFYTMDPQRPTASAVALRGDRILAVGDDEAMRALLGSDGEWVDLHGRCVTPGLVDAHVHFQGFAIYRQRVNLAGAGSATEALQRVAAYAARLTDAAATADGELWLQGRGWSQDEWPGGAFPTAADLDAVVSGIPVCLRHHSGHAAWVNSKALEIAGVDASTPDPHGGQVQRDEYGQPTGILFEEAVGLVADYIPAPTVAEIVAAMREAQAYCWSVGLTGLHDFDRRSSFLALQQLHQGGELGLRVVKNMPVDYLEQVLGVGLSSGFGDAWLRLGSIKIFADGALGPRTAAMLEPYEGEPDNLGIIVTDKEEMTAAVRQASTNGLSVAIHAIGDRANRDVLDVFAAARREEAERLEAGEGQPRQLRHRIEHVQLLHPSDIPRLARLNVIASMQPTHAISDMETADRYWGERAQYSYAWRSVLNTGATLVFGSDAPIERIDPVPGLHAAVTRRRASGYPGPEGWYPEQRLAMHEAVHAFTTAAAATSGQEARFGSIAPGKAADLTIFERDIFTIPPDELLEVGAAATIVAGEFKYRTL